MKTAWETNELKNNKTQFKKRVRTILDEYYSTSKSQRKELKNFKKYVDDSADYIVKHYEEAEAERDNQENLDYETGKEEDGAKMFVIKPGKDYSGYGYSHGTSYATPHVAGTVAMMMSIYYGLSPAQILSRLQSRATKTVKGRKNTNKTFKVLDTGNTVELMEAN